ncbi:MAG: methyltransferase domain-containing protein [Nitrosospira sp.]
MPTKNKLEWFETSLGQYLLEREQNHFDEAVADVFGYNAMQIGFPQYDFLRANRMPLQFCAGTEESAAVRASPEFLPIETNSIDLVLLPHVLEFSSNPHQILREVQRVLMPEGHVIVCGFNPRSLWGVRGVLGLVEDRFLRSVEGQFPWRGNFISLPRLKDWLTLLDFEITKDRLCCYAPPFSQEKWLKRFSFMEAAGDRWWPFSGGIYFLTAVKRVHGMRVIKPEWKEVRAARRGMAPVAQKLSGNRSGRESRHAACSETNAKATVKATAQGRK